MVDSSDTRDFIRMSVECDLVFKKTGDDTVHQTRTRDLSASGVSFFTDQSLSVGDELELNIKPVNKLTPPLYVIAEVIRAELVTPPSTYEIACSIKEHID